MLDGQCLYALGGAEAKGEFGKIRAFGALGYGSFALITGLIVHAGREAPAGREPCHKMNSCGAR